MQTVTAAGYALIEFAAKRGGSLEFACFHQEDWQTIRDLIVNEAPEVAEKLRLLEISYLPACLLPPAGQPSARPKTLTNKEPTLCV